MMNGEPPLSVLVVDDSPEDRVFYRRRLRERMPEIVLHEAECGADGLDLFRTERPDVVLLDYNLPDLDGLEFLGRLSQLEGHDGPLPVIVLTGQGNEAVAVESMKRGAQDYLVKSVITAEALERATRNAYERYSLRRELDQRNADLARINGDLERKNEAIRQFYQLVSHELKNPLTAIREFTAILLDEIPGELNHQQRDLLTTSKQSTEDMTVYINDLLDVARIETGKLEIDPSPTEIRGLVERVVQRYQPDAQKKKVDLSITVETSEGQQVVAEESRIRQVVSNLVGNALKFTEPGGRVDVRVFAKSADCDRDKGEAIAVSVSDTGRGIASDHCDRIFDRHFQTGRNHSNGARGLGLGLNICKEIVALHGGTIDVESCLDVGSTFTFCLPALEAAGTVDDTEPSNRAIYS